MPHCVKHHRQALKCQINLSFTVLLLYPKPQGLFILLRLSDAIDPITLRELCTSPDVFLFNINELHP